jgi:glucan endo-1,3-alpha-glucosidase
LNQGNDYGESSYLNDVVSKQVIPGAAAYVNGFPHSAFRFVLPYFIAAYKAGNTNVAVPDEGVVAWYRTTPASVCSSGGESNRPTPIYNDPHRIAYLLWNTAH